MAFINPAAFSNRDLLLETERAVARERQATAALLALLAEVDTRRLYLGEGFSSLFQYATKRLHLSEPAAYGRITAARAARRFPSILPLVDLGALSLTTIGLLASHLTDDNHSSLLEAARFKSKREVELIVAALHPQPDIRASMRMLPLVPFASGGATTADNLQLRCRAHNAYEGTLAFGDWRHCATTLSLIPRCSRSTSHTSAHGVTHASADRLHRPQHHQARRSRAARQPGHRIRACHDGREGQD